MKKVNIWEKVHDVIFDFKWPYIQDNYSLLYSYFPMIEVTHNQHNEVFKLLMSRISTPTPTSSQVRII